MLGPDLPQCELASTCFLLTQAEAPSQVGWISTIRVLGDTFQISWFYTVHLVMVTLMCIVWLILFILTATAFWKGKIFMAKDEDVLRDAAIRAHAHAVYKEKTASLEPAAPVPRSSFSAQAATYGDIEQTPRTSYVGSRTASPGIGGVYYATSAAPTLVDVTSQMGLVQVHHGASV
jgi:hypothetical protein